MTIFALPKPVVVAAGATQSLQQILRDNFGDSLPTTWTSVSVSYASSTETTRYWNDASPVYSYWTINGAQVDADAASLPVPISDIGNVDLVGGNRLGRTVSINVGGDTYIVNILPPEWVSEHTLPGTPVVEDLTKQAVKIAAEHQSKYGYARPADSDDSISDIAAAAGAPLPALSNSPDPYHNLEGGYWRISYRSNDFSDNEDGWYSELEVGDIVVVATPVPGETRTFIVLDAASGIDGSSYPYKIFYDGSNSYYFATYPYLQDFETLGVYTPLSYPVTIYRLAKDGLYLINGTSGADDLYGSNMRDEIRGLGGDDRFFVAVQGEAMNGGAGHDVLDGGEGVDLAVFELSLEHYHIEESGTGFSILSLDDESEGVDLLQNIEYARFGSEVYALSHMVGGARGKPISVSFDAYDPIAPQSSPREVAGKVVGHDFDPRGLLNYSIVGGADAGLFRIDSATGEIRFINAPQESSHDYAIEVRVADGAVVSVNLEVHIVTAAEPGPKVVTGSPEDDHLSGSIRDDSMSGQAGNDMLDGLGGDDVLNGGEGDDTLDGGDGVDVAVLELSKDQYTIEQEDDHYVIQAIGDGAEGRDLLTNMEYVKFGADTYSVAELVDNVSAKPISVSFSAPDFIADNIKPRTVIGTAIAHDFAANHELTYSITGGADASHFGINSETGEIWFIDSPQGGQPVFEIEVQVSDGDVVSASVAVRIETFVLNQFYPVNGSPDGEKLLGSMRNDLISGGDGDDVIDALGGDDSVIGGVGDDTVYGGDGVDMVVFALPKANYGIGKEGDHYIIQLLAGGAEGRDVVFDVEYAQFGAEIYSLPSLAGGGVNNPISATFERNVFAVGTSRPDDVVGRISAHDFAPNASLRYSILANGSAPVFEVDAETGEVRFIDPAQIASGDYVVKLHVADGFAVGVTVEVLIKAFAASDFNTVNGTQDSEELAGSIRTDIISGQGGDDIIYGLAGDDFVSGDAGDDILSGDAGDDTLDGGAGVDVAVLGSSRENYDVVREGDHYVVQALDDGSDGRDVLFNVEYVKFGADTYFLANLVDTGAHNPISATFKSLGFVVGLSPSYEVVSQVIGHDFDPSAKLTYSIIGEDNQNLFTIDAGTGSIRFIEAPQLANEDYTIEVRVSDGDAVGVNLQVHIKTFDTDYLNPVNGTSGDDSLTGTTRKDILMGYEGNDTIRGLPGDDVVIGGAGDDSLFGGQGVDVAVYDLSWDHYEVSRDESDYFTNFYVNAIDGGTEGRDVLTNIEYVKFGDQIFALKELYGSVTATPISITVDPLPSITDQAGAGEVVATAKAHHFDPEALGYLKYSIVGGADAFRFQIDTQTGEISFRENYYVTDETGMDVEVLMNEPGAHVYDIIVQVNDGSLVQSSVDVKIETAGMHSAPVFLSARTAGVSDVIAKSGVVYRAIAVDEEADGAVSYVIVDGDDKDLFEINPRTGEVRFKQDAWNLDPAGRGHDNHYHIVIQATYYGVSSTSEVEITVVPDKSQRSEHVTLPDDAYVSGLLNGSKWSTKDPDEPKKTVITYSFPKTDAVYQDPYGQLPSDANSSQPFSRFVEALKSFSPVGEVLQKAIVRFLDQYSLIANVSFVSVDGTGADGSTPQADLQFGFSDSLPPYVYGMAAFADKEFIAGDIWVNGVAASYVGDMQSLETVGSVFFETMYHEIGHALGLQHPYSTERETPGDHWTADYTIMLPVLGLGVASEQKNFGFKSGNAAQSPMMDDIRALQVLYGANYKAHSGNTTYRWVSKTGRQTIDDNDGAGAVSQGVPSANVVFVTVWDGDGIDTYDFSNYETDMTIDLQPGGWSVISDSQLARSSGGKATAIGNVFNAYLYNDDPRSLIENAIGGSGNDSITGNQAANHLWGMAGDDRLFGLEGDDTLDGGAGNDQIDGGDGFDTAIIHAKFTDSTIVRNDDGSLTVTTRQGDVETISHVEYLMFSDLGVQVTPLTGLRLKIESGDTASIPENVSSSDVVYTLVASDPDVNAHLTYSLSGADASLFAINDRGEVTFVASPDYEGGQKVYHITVDVADGPAGGVNTLTVSKPVTINVGDVNETPSITSGSVGSARENDAASTVVYTLVASDPDANAHLTYSLSGADASLFAINDRGEVTFVASPDYEGGQKVYHITVDVADGPAGGVNTLTASKPVTITVSDVNEAPSITSGSVGAARENDAASTVVYTVLASDPDANANLTYALSGADSSLFAINDRGEVTFVASPDYEGGQKVYHIMVDVADGPAGGLNTLSASKAVTINVSDVNEAPSITSGSVGSARENDAASTVVYKVVASDPDANANLTYALSGADASLFAINDRGEVTFVASPDYEDPKDAGRDNSYDIVVKVSDGLLSSTKAVAITVSNRNDTPPHLTGGSGNDTLTGTTKGDKFFGGAGIDTVSYADSESSVAVDLLKPINNSGDAAGDTYVSANLFLGAETVSVKVPNFGPGAGAWLSNDRYPRSLVDINNDGKLDIVGFGEAQVYAALGDGKGGFGAVNPVAGLSGFTPVGGGWNSSDRYPRLFADVNNDGLVDAVGFGEAQVFVARGLGGGVFGEMTPNATLSNLTPRGGGWSSNDRYPRFLVDVNGDGNIDAVGFGEEHVFAALGDGKGNFAQAKPIAGLDGFTSKGGGWNSNDVFPRMFGDVNGDGNLDVIGFGWAKVWVSLGDGKGSFQPMTGVVENFTAGAGGWVNSKTYPRFVSDMNGDGMADLVGFGEAGVYVSLATGGGNFAAPQLVFNNLGRGDQAGGWVNNDLYPRLLGDLNGDGASDIAGFGYAGVYTVINGVDRVENATGSAFGDRLSGDNGANVLTGGGGADTLAGRGGADTFVYTAVLDSTAAAADTITDFEHGIDKIDLSQIDINASQAGRQGFHFGATTTGAITAGDLVYDAATGVLSGYVDGDAVPDFQIILANKAALSAGDFVL